MTKATILRTVLTEIIGFLLLCVCGTVVGGILFMFYGASTSYVIGGKLNAFSADNFLNGMLLFFPTFLLFVPMLRLLSLVRHQSKNKLFGIITLSVLTLATWIFCMPICKKALQPKNTLSKKQPTELTAGYFREIGREVYYFNSVNGKSYNALNINALKFENDYSNKNNSERNVELLNNHTIDFTRDKYGFSDPLVGNYMQPPTVLAGFFQMLFSIEQSAFNACSAGIAKWLCFSSIIFALLAASALLCVSSWRLVCAFWILFTTSATILLNYLYFNFYFAPLIKNFDNLGAFFIFIKNNFQIVMNCVIIVVLVVAGILCRILKNKDLSGDDL